jgi:vitamin K-dependent gamma-carboxylase
MKALFRQVDIPSIVFIRIVFGALAFGEMMGLFAYYHLTKDTFNPEKFHFRYHVLDWVKPLHEPYMSIVFGIGLIASLGVLFGKFYRASCLITFVVLLYAFSAEQSLYLNHGYLMIWLSFILAFFPMNRSFSLDVHKRPALRLKTVPLYYQFILAFLMGVVYFYGGLAKLNPDWIRAQPLLIWMEYKRKLFLIGPIVQKDIVAWVMSIGGLAFDLSCAFLLMFKRTRKLGMALAISFHITNVLIFNIGAFPWLSISLSLMFFSPDLIPKFLTWLDKKWSFWARKRSTYNNRFAVYGGPMAISAKKGRYMQVLLISLVSFHLLVPLRHHLYSGNVNWTEEGHKFSWRMMLRNKSGTGEFLIKDGDGVLIKRENGRSYLSRRQRQKMLGQPDMILQFGQFLGAEYKAKGYEDVSVFANIRIKLNANDYQQFINPEVDLMHQKWHAFESEDWIMPFEYSH